MTNDPLDELGPVDFVIIEFPAGEANFTGEAADELAALIEAGTIRLVDLLILTKDDDGCVDAVELADLHDLGPFEALEQNSPSSWPRMTSSTWPKPWNPARSPV